MRPISLVTNALTDWERPQMGRRVAADDLAGARSSVRMFRIMLILAWIGTIALAAGLVIWAPQLLFPPKYDRAELMTGMVLSLAIALIRLLRSPESVLLQAAGEFRPLANASLVCCFVSVIFVVLMVSLWAPVWSLLGILAGEAIFALSIWRACARWSAQARPAKLPSGRSSGVLEEQAQT
jgi:O-antigen/teichoic acid export membrane protein